jgi:hypothetical protein
MKTSDAQLACSRRWKVKNPEKVKGYNKTYREKNKPKIKAAAERREKNKAYAKEYRDKNPEYAKNYREKNKERITETTRLKRLEFPEKHKAAMAKHKAKDPERYRARQRAWYHENKHNLGVIRENPLLSPKREYACQRCGVKDKGKAMHLCLTTMDIFCGKCVH